MSIVIKGSMKLPGGNTSSIIHNGDNSVWMFTDTNGKFTFSQGNVPLGIWDVLDLTQEQTLIVDNEVELVRSKSITDVLNLVVWKDGNYHRILAFPDDYKLYDPTSVHRLYWAVDTEKLYMNISDTWQMIGTLKHDLMKDTGKYKHDNIDSILDHICNKLEININDLINE